ncbi:MAG: hypothetical protein E6I26_12155 [Chloroflexi bacterium]|nr:MAG: hypothetical protein E6I26_12155 [Chloroflexota bacterium]
MSTIILGDGPLGTAIEAALRARGEPATIRGRPRSGRHDPRNLTRTEPTVDVIVDASRAEAVLANVEAGLAAGCRRFVIATTGWADDRAAVASRLRGSAAAAVVAPNLAMGAAVFLRLVEEASSLAAAIGGFDPSVVEWHRRAKADRPSGTARELVRRIAPHLPIAVVEVAVVRSGAMPGLHLVGLDSPSETIELRLTARDRSGYAAGALAAIDWLRAQPRQPGLHPFDTVVDDLIAARRHAAPESPAQPAA